jgi:DNA-binding NarL/FixJ family response regulator
VEGRDTILLVQADPALRSEVAAALKQAGLIVAEASTGAEALALAGELGPAAALVDSQLPDIQSFELVSRLKEVCPQTPSSVAVSPSGSVLVVSRVNPGHVASYRIGQQTGDLTPISGNLSTSGLATGDSPNHVVLVPR